MDGYVINMVTQGFSTAMQKTVRKSFSTDSSIYKVMAMTVEK